MSIIQSVSGRCVSLTNPDLNTYCVEDIAHALAHVCRFAGHTKKFYSVAQHSVLVSLYEPNKMPMEKLFHDSSEAYLGDVSTPLKNMLPEYRAIEKSMMDAIADWLLLPRGFHKFEAVKEADHYLLMAEKRDLMEPSCFDLQLWDIGAIYANRHNLIIPWSPKEAKDRFIERYEALLSVNAKQHA